MEPRQDYVVASPSGWQWQLAIRSSRGRSNQKAGCMRLQILSKCLPIQINLAIFASLHHATTVICIMPGLNLSSSPVSIQTLELPALQCTGSKPGRSPCYNNAVDWMHPPTESGSCIRVCKVACFCCLSSWTKHRIASYWRWAMKKWIASSSESSYRWASFGGVSLCIRNINFCLSVGMEQKRGIPGRHFCRSGVGWFLCQSMTLGKRGLGW